MTSRVAAVHGPVPTSLAEVYETAVQTGRVLSLYVANTTAATVWFRLVLDKGGVQTDVLPEIPTYAGETFEWVPGLYLLTKDTQDGRIVVGDKLFVEAESVGLDMHLFVEQMEAGT